MVSGHEGSPFFAGCLPADRLVTDISRIHQGLFEGISSQEPATYDVTVRLGIHSTPFGAFCLAAEGQTVYGAGFVGASGVAPGDWHAPGPESYF